jgi:hypothetical protein
MFLLILLVVWCVNSESLFQTIQRYRKEVRETIDAIEQNHRNVEPRAKCPVDSSHSLEFTREGVVYCLHHLADTNCDHKIDAGELTAFKDRHLTTFERTVFFFKSSVPIVMNACDKDKDGFISEDEFLNNYDGCLNNQREMCYARDICYREITNNPAKLCTN